MIDEELLHRVIDGEATPDERHRLEGELGRDPTVRARFEELQRLKRAIDSVPRVEAPTGLLQAVMAAIRSRSRAQASPVTAWAGLRAAFARRPELSLALAFASGMLLAALAGGLADLGTWPRGGSASATMLSGERLALREIHRISLDGQELRVLAISFSADDRVVVRVRLEGPGRGDLTVSLAGEKALLGFLRRSGSAESVVLGPDELLVRGTGAGELELVVSGPPLVDSVEIRLAVGDGRASGVLRLRAP